MKEIKLHRSHRKRIKTLYKERYSLDELYIMYREIIPIKQLRSIVKDVKRYEKI